MAAITLAALKTFTDEYRDFAARRIPTFKWEHAHFKCGFDDLWQRLREKERSTGRSFNLFNVLGLSSYEVRTHTPFLAYFLDPSESHGQEGMLLSKFFRVCNAKLTSDGRKPSLPTEISQDEWLVVRERREDCGQPDIRLSSYTKGWVVVVENKTTKAAVLQHQQLIRYGDWMKLRSKDFPNQLLIFLNPVGSEPPKKEQPGCKYIVLSYKSDIVDWIDSCLDAIDSPRTREALIQYSEISRDLAA